MTCGWKPANIGGSRFQTARSCEYESNRDNGRYDRWAKMSSSRVAMFLSHIWPHTMPYAIPFSPQFLSVFIISNSNISHCIPFICIYVYNDHILHWGAVPLFWRFSLLQIHFPGIFSMKFYQQVPLMDFMNHWTPESGTTETLGEFVPRCGFGDVSNLYLISIWIMFKTEYIIRMYKLLRYTGLRIEIWLIDLHGWLISSYHHTVSISEHQWASVSIFHVIFHGFLDFPWFFTEASQDLVVFLRGATGRKRSGSAGGSLAASKSQPSDWQRWG